MSRTLRRIGAVFAIAVLGILACPDSQPDHRREVLVSVDGLVTADLEQASADAQALDAAVQEFCTAPDSTGLDASQAAWVQLRQPWKRVLALPFGPVVEGGFESAIDFWPARPTSIDGGLASGAQAQADIDALGVASKGMPAIEYLLWDPASGDGAILELFTAAEGQARCDYLELLAADVELRLAELQAAWVGFGAELADAGSSESYPTLALAIDDLLNAMIGGLHDLDDKKLGKPLGEVGAAQPELVESRFSDNSLQDARDSLDGFARAYLGTPSAPGLTLVVAGESGEVDERVRTALAAAEQALADVPEPLRSAVVDSPTSVASARDAVHELRTIMTAEVASLLGVTVSLSDNDGD